VSIHELPMVAASMSTTQQPECHTCQVQLWYSESSLVPEADVTVCAVPVLPEAPGRILFLPFSSS
jgi:hypothetical protein